MRAFRRHSGILRTASLVLLMLGMLVGPVLAAVGELHAVEHAAMSAGHGAHPHGHSIGSHDHPGGQVDPDHAKGGHGLMHQTGSVSATLPEAEFRIEIQPASDPRLPEVSRFHLPGDSPSLPFRPPIA